MTKESDCSNTSIHLRLLIVEILFSTNCKIWDFCPFLLRSGTWRFLQRPLQSPVLCGLKWERKEKVKLLGTKHCHVCIRNNLFCFFLLLTCKVEDLRPLLADVDTNVRPSDGQVGSTLIEHKGLHLRRNKNKYDVT